MNETKWNDCTWSDHNNPLQKRERRNACCYAKRPKPQYGCNAQLTWASAARERSEAGRLHAVLGGMLGWVFMPRDTNSARPYWRYCGKNNRYEIS